MPGQLMFHCPACSIRAYVPFETPRIACACGYVQMGGVTPGLGDYVAAGLHRIGITRARYLRVKRLLGLTPACRCPQRQRSLNALGGRIRAFIYR